MEKATGEREANVIGYCLGGTLLASTLAYMKAKGDDRIKSATYFVALVDFKEAGELSVFIDEEQLHFLEKRMSEHGYLEGSDMANTFNMLRANDLIWSFVVNNYLLGKEPFPFDLLYWNSDSTRMPAAMHSFYLRNMYQENKLVVPGGITLAGVPIDLSHRRHAELPAVDAGGSHRAVEVDLFRDADIQGTGQVHPRRLRPHRRRRQPARQGQVRSLGQRQELRRAPTTGSPPPSRIRARGGPPGRSGSPTTPAARFPRASPATASSSRSRTRRDPTCR